MSGLALLLKARGHEVSGSDASDSDALMSLRAAGIRCDVGQSADNLGHEEAVFYSSAIPADNPEFAAARERGLPLYHRSQLLACLANAAGVSIAVAGTHGKSTTSAMIAHILAETGHNPTALLGAVYPPFGSNVRVGDPELVVLEADESDGSFTLTRPTVSVVLNVEPEHLENYDHREDELWRAFQLFAENTSARLILNADDPPVVARLSSGTATALTYSTRGAPSNLRAAGIAKRPGRTLFQLQPSGEIENPREYSLRVAGEHNVSNGLAAILAAGGLVPATEAAQALESFAGTLRRFEFKGEADGVAFYDDYGHHPTEVRATLDAAREFLDRPLLVIFQPHRYSRTEQLWELFGTSRAFAAASRVIITELYSAFEEPIPGISGRLVYEAVRASLPGTDVQFAVDQNSARSLALETIRPGDAVITMGAGDITRLGPRLLADWKSRHHAS